MHQCARLLSALLLVFVLVPVAHAAVTITVDQISARVPDTDGVFDGDSDPVAYVTIHGNQMGATTILTGTNFPNWGTQSFSILLPLDPFVVPTITIQLDLYDDDIVGQEYHGTATFTYAWPNLLPVVDTQPLVGPHCCNYEATIRMQAELEPVSTEASSWGATKALFR